MAWISAPEVKDSYPQASLSELKTVNGLSYDPNAQKDDPLSVRLVDNENPLADFDKLPTELLVKIFHHARADSLYDAHNEKQRYPVALSHVCRYWRTVAIGAPTLWTDIRGLYYTEEAKEATRVYLERSKTCPLFFTWFTEGGMLPDDIPAIVRNIITPEKERWQRITLITHMKTTLGDFLTAIESLDFPILQDVEISCDMISEPFSPKSTLCRSTPLLRRCRFRDTISLPALPSDLVVLDFVSLAHGSEFDLDPFLEFLPHVAHSLEHLRFGPPPASTVHFTPGAPKIPLENLKSLLITHSHVIMNHILAPNVTYFVAANSRGADPSGAAEMFQGFSAPKLRSIQFHNTPLFPLLAMHNLPSMFPQLESVRLSDCTNESAFVLLLANAFSHLKELTISDVTVWTSLQAAIEKHLKNGNKSLRKIQLPKGDATETVILRRWLPARGIELVLYEPEELPMSTPEFQDESCDEEDNLFIETTMRGSELGDDDYDYGLPSYVDSRRHQDIVYDFDYEEGYE